MTETELPEFLRPLFWDTNFDRLRIAGHEQYIIKRMLEFGDLPEVRLSARWTVDRSVSSLSYTS